MRDIEEPEKPFFMVLSIGYLDGSIDLCENFEGCFETEKEAVARMKQNYQQDADLESVVFAVTPLWRTKRYYRTHKITHD